MKFRSIAIAIICAIFLGFVESRFYIETVGRLYRHPNKPHVNGVFLYKCSKTLTEDQDYYFINCVAATKSREKSQIYSNANFYHLPDAELMEGHILGVNGKEVPQFRSDFFVGYLPVGESRANSRRSKKRSHQSQSVELPEILEFPNFQMFAPEYQQIEEEVVEIGVPNFSPIANIESMHELTTVMSISDIAAFWTPPDDDNHFAPHYFFTFLQVLNRIAEVYFEQIHRTPEMISKNMFPEYIVPMGRPTLKTEEKWKKGVEDVQNAIKLPMNKMIDPCVISDVSSRMETGEFFSKTVANDYCMIYCRFLKAAFLVHNIPGECATIEHSNSGCNGAVCTCVTCTTGRSCFKQNKEKAMPMHSCNNTLRLKLTNRKFRERKMDSARREKLFRDMQMPRSRGPSDTVPWAKGSRPSPNMYPYRDFSPGSSPLSDRGTPRSRSTPGSPFDG